MPATIRVCDFRLRPGESPGRALELLHQAAMQHFANADMADLWMRSTNPRLDHRRPADGRYRRGGVGAVHCLIENQKGRRS
jgi:hypothetical protein